MKTDLPTFLKEGVHVQMLINRGIPNDHGSSRRRLNRLVSNNPSEYDENVETLIQQQEHIGCPDVRLYASLNPRVMKKAIRMLKHQIIDAEEENFSFYKRIHDKFVSCLMSPSNKMRLYYLVDIDTKNKEVIETIEKELWALTQADSFKYPTPNGIHLIAAPFNTFIFDRYLEEIINEECAGIKVVEVKTDALVLLNTID